LRHKTCAIKHVPYDGFVVLNRQDSNATELGGLFMVTRLGVMICGFGMLFYAWRLYTIPLALEAPERHAALYQYLGQEGQAATAAIVGLFLLVVGVILVWNMLRRIWRLRVKR
jgi:hypothetical protein